MALLPSYTFTINSLNTLITFTDTIGRYDVTLNTDGYGTPNDDYANISLAEIVIYDLDDTILQTVTVKSTADSVDQHPASPYPQTFAVAAETWAQGDGVYQIDYLITGTVSAAQGKVEHLVIVSLMQCMRDQQLLALKECNEELRMKFFKRADEMRMIIMGIQSSFSCGNFADAAAAIVTATTLCTNYNNCEC